MTNAAIEAIATLLEKTPVELGEAIWNLATCIEGQGNKGYTLFQLNHFAEREDLKIETYFLPELHKDAYDGILFEAKGGRRKHEAVGWMVRKNPHWKLVWMARYGDTNPDRLMAFQRAADEEAARLAAAPKRANEDSPGARFDTLTTLQVGHRLAAAWIMSEQAKRLHRERAFNVPLPDPDEPKRKSHSNQVPLLDSMDAYSANVWIDQQGLMWDELRYRAETGDELAHEILRAGTAYFYTRNAERQMADSDLMPMFTNGYLGQPFDEVQPPIHRLRDWDVMKHFVMLLDPEGTLGGKFEDDDLKVILGILRAQLKRLKPRQE